MMNKEYRTKAATVLQDLREEAATNIAPSWICDRPTSMETNDTLSTTCQDVNFFDHAGFIHIPSFCSLQECEQMKSEMTDIVNAKWRIGSEPVESFGTNDAQNSKRGDYFLESSNAVHFFAEPSALNADGTLQESYRSC